MREPNGGTLLDNSAIVYGATLGDGNEHDAQHLPTLLAGGGGGTIATGRLLEHAEPTDLARIHVSLLQGMGVPVDRFGTADGPLEGLRDEGGGTCPVQRARASSVAVTTPVSGEESRSEMPGPDGGGADALPSLPVAGLTWRPGR